MDPLEDSINVGDQVVIINGPHTGEVGIVYQRSGPFIMMEWKGAIHMLVNVVDIKRCTKVEYELKNRN